jgi:hypothetical protein
MKKILSVSALVLFMGYSFGQDRMTLLKLHDVSEALGIINSIFVDTMLLYTGIERTNKRIAEQHYYLLKAAQYYQLKEYSNSIYYIKKVINFQSVEYNALKYLVLIGNYASVKDVKNTAKYFYQTNKSRIPDPESMECIRAVIRENFKRDEFSKALSSYYYYHERLKIVDDMRFRE